MPHSLRPKPVKNYAIVVYFDHITIIVVNKLKKKNKNMILGYKFILVSKIRGKGHCHK